MLERLQAAERAADGQVTEVSPSLATPSVPLAPSASLGVDLTKLSKAPAGVPTVGFRVSDAGSSSPGPSSAVNVETGDLGTLGEVLRQANRNTAAKSLGEKKAAFALPNALGKADTTNSTANRDSQTLTLKPSIKYVVAGFGYTSCMFCLLIGAMSLANLEVIGSPLRLALVLSIFLIAPIRQFQRYSQTKTVISLDDLVHESGKQRKELFLSHVEKVHFEQGLLQKLVGCGTVYIKKHDEIMRTTLEHMDNPKQLAATILERAQA
jgi:hypothetical protein